MAKALTKTQIDHLEARLDMAITEAQAKFKSKLPAPKYLSDVEKAAIIRANKGGFKLILRASGTLPYAVSDLFEFDADVAARKLKEANDTAVRKFGAPLLAEKQRIMDRAVLGGAEEALKAMEQFIAKLSK